MPATDSRVYREHPLPATANVGTVAPPAARTAGWRRCQQCPPTEPYTIREQVALRSWATGQVTPYREVTCHVLLALGLGAGLSAGEVGAVQAKHLHCDADGVLVEVVGKRARLVPVLAEWEPVLVNVAGTAMRPDLYVFRPRRDKAHQNTDLQLRRQDERGPGPPKSCSVCAPRGWSHT